MSLSINISDNQNEPTPESKTKANSTKPTRVKYKGAKSIPLKRNGDTRDKKTTSKTGKSKKRYFLFFFVLIICGLGAFAAVRVKSFTDEVGIDLSPKDIISPVKKDPELQKDATGTYTNALLVGIDTRATDKGLQNTDTIIVASYNHKRNDITMISIPRDTYVAVPGTENYIKINGIYNIMENEDEGEGLEYLKDVVEEYIGMDIQYYGMVDVQGLSKVIDIMGGVTVNVENSFTDYAYPNESDPNLEYQTVSFVAGPQNMNGETAVKYARSRKSLDNGEGTDFARAKRQQILIEAIKNKALSANTLLDPSKILDIMVQVEENITVSEFTNEDIQAGLKLLVENPDLKVHSFVLDPYIGARNVIMEGAIPGSYALTPVEGIGLYSGVHDFVSKTLTNPEFYEEEAKINVYDIGMGYYPAYEKTLQLIDELPYSNIVYQGTLFTDKTGDYVYDNSADSSKPTSVIQLSNILTGTENLKPEYITTNLNGEDITILLGAPKPEPAPTQEDPALEENAPQAN